MAKDSLSSVNSFEIPEHLYNWLQQTNLSSVCGKFRPTEHFGNDLDDVVPRNLTFVECHFTRRGLVRRFIQRAAFEQACDELYQYLSQDTDLPASTYAVELCASDSNDKWRFGTQVPNFKDLFGIHPKDVDLGKLMQSMYNYHPAQPLFIDRVKLSRSHAAPMLELNHFRIMVPYHRFTSELAKYSTDFDPIRSSLVEFDTVQLLPITHSELEEQKKAAHNLYQETARLEHLYTEKFGLTSPVLDYVNLPSARKRLVALNSCDDSLKDSVLAERELLRQIVETYDYEVYQPRAEFFSNKGRDVKNIYVDFKRTLDRAAQIGQQAAQARYRAQKEG
jgi:hypothetical protein